MTPFRRLWLAQSVSLLGDFVAVFAVQVAVTFRMHGSPRDMAGVFIAGLIPGMILGPVAGALVDRWDRGWGPRRVMIPRHVMIWSDLARGVLILLLTFAGSLREIYAISFAVGCASSFFNPAQAITLPRLVPRERLLAANARMQQTMQLVRIASPAVAGALLAAWGERACYVADSASFVLSAALLSTLRYARPTAAPGPAAVWSESGTGMRFLLRDHRFSPVVLAMAVGTFAAGCFASLASLYVRDTLHRGPSVLALIGSLIAAGTVAGSAVLSRYARRFDPRFLIPVGMTGVGASILLMAAIPRTDAAYIGSTGMGLAVALVMVAAATMLQGETPPAMRGRVSGASTSLAAFAQLSALLLAGTWAASIGIRGVFLVSAALLFAAAGNGFLRRLKPANKQIHA